MIVESEFLSSSSDSDENIRNRIGINGNGKLNLENVNQAIGEYNNFINIKNGNLVSGTLNGIIRHLVLEMVDSTVLEHLFMTFRLFCSKEFLCQELCNMLREGYIKRENNILRMRTFIALRMWLKEFKNDFISSIDTFPLNSSCISSCKDTIQVTLKSIWNSSAFKFGSFTPSDNQILYKLNELIENLNYEMKKNFPGLSICNNEDDAKSQSSKSWKIQLSGIANSTSNDFSSTTSSIKSKEREKESRINKEIKEKKTIWSFASEDLTRQLCIFEWKFMQSIDWMEMIALDGKLQDRITDHFNQCCKWFMNNNEKNLFQRKMIKLAQKSIKYHNYNTAMQIICALQMQSNSKENDGNDNLNDNNDGKRGAEGEDWELLQEFASPINNFNRLRKAHDACFMSSNNKITCIPFFGLFITDLKINNEREEYYDESERKILSFDLIPWWKYNMTAKIITPLRLFLKREKYSFEINAEIYNKLFI